MVLSVFAGSIAFTGSAAAADHEFAYEGGAVHYDNGSAAVIEVPFNNEVNSSSLTVANFTLMDDDENVSDQITGFSTDAGTLTITTSDVVRSNDLELEISSDVENSTGAALSNAGTKTVSFAAVTLKAQQDKNAYKGSKVAVVAENTSTELEITSTDDDIDFFRSGNTGPNSTVYVFDTADREVGEYQVTYENGTTTNVTVRELGLDIEIDDLTIDTDDSLEGTVSANAGTRDVKLQLLDSNEDEVENQTVTLSGQAEADFDFNVTDTGNYTVEATDLDSGVSVESSSVEVSKAGTGKADIGGAGIVTEQRGDIANITITLSNTDTATLTVGSDDVGFLGNVTVEDANDDGQVNVLFNTYAATDAATGTDISGSNVFATPNVDGTDDSIEDAELSQGVSTLLDAGEYDLEVRAGDDPADDSQGVGTLVLEERNTTSIASWTAPTGDDDDYEDTEDLYEAISNENLTASDNIAYSDVAVHQLQASGLAGLFNAEESGEVTTEFFNNNGNEYQFTVEQVNPGANRDAYNLVLDSSNTSIFADPANDTYFVVYDTGDVGSDARSVENDHSLNANFTVYEDEGNLTDEDQTVEDEYSLVEAEHTVDEPVNVSASADQEIMGETNVAPGTEITLRVRSTGDTQPSFLKTATVYVSANQTYFGTFDFSEQETGDTFDLTVRGGAAPSETFEGNVGDATSMTETDMSTETEMTETATATEEPDTETATATATDASETETATEEPTDEPTETSTGTPGFGVVVAVTALLAAALLAVRRD